MDQVAAANTVRVGSFNVRNGVALAWANLWWRRREATVAAVAGLDADVVGLQEVHGFQLRWLLRQLPGYRADGDGRSWWGGERCSVLSRVPVIAARTLRFDAGGRFPRVATVVDTERFQVANTHLDERRPDVRLAQVLELLGRLDPARPAVVVGDLNARPRSDVLAACTDAGLRDVLPVDAPGTFHRFTGRTDGPRIDHVLVSEHWDVLDAHVAATPDRRPLPSDHWPVVADLRLA